MSNISAIVAGVAFVTLGATTPTEAYAVPVSCDPVIRDETREITFLFPSVSAAHLSGPFTPAMAQKIGVLEIVGSARLDGEEFPELLSAIRETNWPPVVQNRGSHVPSTVGEDHREAICSGTLIVATGDDTCHMPTSVGEDYGGSQCSPAAGNQTTIVLDLKFLHTVPEPSVEAHSRKELECRSSLADLQVTLRKEG
jgi:hypothetical protein